MGTWVLNIFTLIVNNLDVLAIAISVISLMMNISERVWKKKNEKIDLGLSIKTLYKLTNLSNVLFLELSITNNSRLKVTIDNISIKLKEVEHLGKVHDVNQKFIKDKIDISDLPITISGLDATRFWMRFNFDDKLPEELSNEDNELHLVCFGKTYVYKVSTPSLTDNDGLMKIL